MPGHYGQGLYDIDVYGGELVGLPPVVPTRRAQRMLDSLPHYYYGDPFLRRVIVSLAREVDRYEAHVEAIRDGMVPTMATDLFGMLGHWEAQLGLEPERSDVPLGARQAIVGARIHALVTDSGAEWANTMEAAAGSTWAHFENTDEPGELLIEVPYDPGSWRTGQIEEIARIITPAAWRIVMRYSEGFILDVSLLDQDAL